MTAGYLFSAVLDQATRPRSRGSVDAVQRWTGPGLSAPRWAGWRGAIPFGLAPTLWTTGIELSGMGPEGPFIGKDLVLVDVDASPWRLYTGQDDNPTLLDAEGYPAFMLDGFQALQ